MHDRQIIEKIKNFSNDFTYEFRNGVCTKISFVNKHNIFYGTIRHSSYKQNILDLVSQLEGLEYIDLQKINY